MPDSSQAKEAASTSDRSASLCVHFPRRGVFPGTLFLSVVLLMSAGCKPAIDPSLDQTLKEFPMKRLERYREWRDVRELSAGAGRTINLGAIPPGGVLRLGLLEGEPHGSAATVRVYAGARRIQRLRTGRTPRWGNYRIPLGDWPGEECRLVINSERSLWAGPCEVVAASPDAVNVLVFLIDTLRQDHLGYAGYNRPVSPHLDALARESLVFTQLMPQSSWTKPSVASLLTSTYPNTHGARDRPDILRSGLPSLATALAEAGYETHGLIANPNILPLWGFGKDFSRYADVDSADIQNYNDAKIVDEAIQTLRFVRGKPWFLYVHCMGPHQPYEPPAEYAARFAAAQYEGEAGKRQEAMDRYDAEIAFTDAQFGRLMEELRRQKLLERTLLIVLSDHGEEFWEHGKEGHGKDLHEEVLRVPLLIRFPDGAFAGETRDGLIENVDVAPTLLEWLGIARPRGFRGRSFLPMLRGGKAEERLGFASLVYDAYSLRTVKDVRRKYIRNVAEGMEAWYDLERDPGERRPVLSSPDDWQDLEIHARRMAVQGSSGLHVLMTCGEEERRVAGHVRGAGLGAYELDYYEWKGSAEKGKGGVRFDLQTKHPDDRLYHRDHWHGEIAEQDHAHLRIEAAPETPFELRIELRGVPVEQDWLFLGHDLSPGQPEEKGIRPLDLLADPDTFDPAALPRCFAVYVWYVAPPDSLDAADLDPHTRQAMEALGYL